MIGGDMVRGTLNPPLSITSRAVLSKTLLLYKSCPMSTFLFFCFVCLCCYSVCVCARAWVVGCVGNAFFVSFKSREGPWPSR